ncbi:ribonuclease domain-containing protein [Allocoleopsis franciscana]|uniref:Guanyl-specific ribonuclease Sa n=1 Tax=Allocoleopsis franciscana PCC 7113 TaxID=1173027 RepID=K9WM10_9CYAN|nr:ribonuclease domain-containing protein [Allocoleopsis franciscana]AFZ21218.1 guanyl-specific ribonuclease Sa [Allocoleopsis franciscana PCC 7113]
MKLITKGFSLLLSSLTLIGLSPLAEGKATFQPITEETGTTITAQRQMSTLPINQLPREAQITINLIYKGGPFPYRQDGTIFRNREKRLPPAPVGYYREYTVPTPGSPNRGARRLVTGQGNEIYYTGDHYRSFVRVQ